MSVKVNNHRRIIAERSASLQPGVVEYSSLSLPGLLPIKAVGPNNETGSQLGSSADYIGVTAISARKVLKWLVLGDIIQVW